MYIVGDLVKDFNINLQYTLQGILSSGQIDRSFVVAGIGTAMGDPTDPELFGTAALAYLQSNASGYNLSEGSAHPVYTALTARQFSVRPIDSANAVQIVASYLLQQLPIDPTVWTIESSTYTEMLETDIQYNPAWNSSNASTQTFVPISIANHVVEWGSYQKSDGSFNPSPLGTPMPIPGSTNGSTYTVVYAPPAFGTVHAAKLRKQWTYTKTIYSASAAMNFDAATLNYVNTVNSVPFLGNQTGSTAQNLNLPTGTVWCAAAGVQFNLASGQYIATITLVYKPEGWQPWARYYNSNLGGVPANIWRAGSLGTNNYPANGTVQANEYLATNHNTLLTLI